MLYPIPQGYELVEVQSRVDSDTESLWFKLRIAGRFWRNSYSFFHSRSPWAGVISKMMREGGPSYKYETLVCRQINGDPEELFFVDTSNGPLPAEMKEFSESLGYRRYYPVF